MGTKNTSGAQTCTHAQTYKTQEIIKSNELQTSLSVLSLPSLGLVRHVRLQPGRQQRTVKETIRRAFNIASFTMRHGMTIPHCSPFQNSPEEELNEQGVTLMSVSVTGPFTERWAESNIAAAILAGGSSKAEQNSSSQQIRKQKEQQEVDRDNMPSKTHPRGLLPLERLHLPEFPEFSKIASTRNIQDKST